MSFSHLKCRFVQITCLLLQAVVLAVFAYFIAAVFAISGKGPNPEGMTLKVWGYVLFALIIMAPVYWSIGRIRDRATRQLRPTIPDSELRTPPSELR